MKRKITVIFPSLFIILTALFSLLLLSCRKSSGHNVREVVLYCSVDQGLAEPVIAEFEKQTGI